MLCPSSLIPQQFLCQGVIAGTLAEDFGKDVLFAENKLRSQAGPNDSGGSLRSFAQVSVG